MHHRVAFLLLFVALALPCSAAVSHGFRVPDGFEVSLYAGDDRTDIDAFRALRALQHEGRLSEILCVGVRSEQTPSELLAEADLLVDGTEGVSSLLSALAD